MLEVWPLHQMSCHQHTVGFVYGTFIIPVNGCAFLMGVFNNLNFLPWLWSILDLWYIGKLSLSVSQSFFPSTVLLAFCWPLPSTLWQFSIWYDSYIIPYRRNCGSFCFTRASMLLPLFIFAVAREPPSDKMLLLYNELISISSSFSSARTFMSVSSSVYLPPLHSPGQYRTNL